MIKTKSVKDPVEKSDGTRILVTRYPVRTRKNIPPYVMEKARILAPSVELLKDWRNGKVSWEEYKMRYYKEMSGAYQQAKIKELALRSQQETITLLCFEEESDPCCHRHLLKKLVENARFS
jgi:uncharacterized protein YeaO (DUF488 family)